MRDYEMVELKLSVALEEGIAGRGLPSSGGRFVIERLMPGLYALGVPAGAHTLSLVVLTDQYDLGLLGIQGEGQALLVVHDRDLQALAEHGIELVTGQFAKRESLAGWNFLAFPWNEPERVDQALRVLLPTYNPAGQPPGLVLER